MNDTLLFLSQIRENLQHASYDLIYQSIIDMQNKYFPTAILHKGTFIDRVRIHDKPDQVFTCKNEVSYISDKDVISKMTSFGRANIPHQTVFYGSIETPEISQQRVTAYFETTKLLPQLTRIGDNSEEVYKNVSEIFTVSRWKLMEDIEVIEMIYSDDALKVNSITKASYEHQLSNLENHPLKDLAIDQGRFFSNEFARKDGNNDDSNYKISAAYSNFIFNHPELKNIAGITYPSVQSDFRGQNVVLKPSFVNRFLHLELVAMMKFERIDGVDQPIDSFRMATNLGENESDFQWYDYRGVDHIS